MTLATSRNRVPVTVEMMKISMTRVLLELAGGILVPFFCNARKRGGELHNRDFGHVALSGFSA
jgi:hypothetical protein